MVAQVYVHCTLEAAGGHHTGVLIAKQEKPKEEQTASLSPLS